MHKLRRAMVRPVHRLDGVVEVDDTSVGGRERGKVTAGQGMTNRREFSRSASAAGAERSNP